MSLRSLWRSVYSRRRWLTIGIGIKRWLVLLVVGALLTGFGWAAVLTLPGSSDTGAPGLLQSVVTLQFLPLPLRILLPLVAGGGMMLYAVIRLSKNLVAPLRPLMRAGSPVVDSLYDYRLRDRGPRIVAIGGGTGLPSLLRGLTPYTSNITAIITVADDGGSSGRLRRELGLLPPGDFRNNLAALSSDEALMTQVLQYRFGAAIDVAPVLEGDAAGDIVANGKKPHGQNSTLQGHAFGNLLLAALTGITGSFDEALLAAQRVLALRGQVLPSTLENVTLTADIRVPDEPEAVMHVVGESAIPKAAGIVERVYLEPGNARAYPPALRAIFQADLIVLGPGSLFTSILPNVLVKDLCEALIHARAPKVYVCNLATQPGETDGFSVADHVAAINRHVAGQVLDVVLANDNLSIPPETGGGNTEFVPVVQPEGVRLVTTDLVDEARPWRHDSSKLGRAVLGLLP